MSFLYLKKEREGKPVKTHIQEQHLLQKCEKSQ